MPSPELLARLGELSDLRHAGQVLAWDQMVMMPPAGAAARGRALGAIESLAHERLVAPQLGALLDAERADAQLVRTVRRDHEVARRVPSELAVEMTLAGSEGYAVWLRAREANDFAVFEPALRRNIELARRYADCFAESEHPYDPLLDRYEPGTTTAQVASLFARLRDGLVPLLGEIARRPAPPALSGDFPIAAQRELGLQIAHAMGFDEHAWRLDDAVHPFASSPAGGDIRVTSRFDEHSLTGLFALMHEVGHGLYEHGVDPALARTTLDSGVSLGVHESQSRLWENQVGRGEPFWSHWLPRLRHAIPTLGDVALEDFLRAINVVEPTLIRVEADELTYSLHVVLRFELELALIEGTLDPGDLPQAWSDKTRELLGIEVPDDLHGVLQDIHWSEGIIGYFPTYTIGNVLAAQLWRAVRADLPGLDDELCAGDYAGLRDWLVDKVHRHGRRLTPAELIEQAVGGPLDEQPMLEHLSVKYRALYGLPVIRVPHGTPAITPEMVRRALDED
ncbi:MAG: carboxypeptidase M32 [Solirubrobacteraceae bacterium]